MAYANGLIPLSAMSQLSTGGYLLANAAAAFETWRVQARTAGFDMRPTSNSDAFRSLAVQEAIFFARYSRTDYGRRTNGAVKTYRGVVYYLKPGFAVAATPGSSNHGKGLAVDIRNAGPFGGAYHNWMSRTGPALGFTNVEGRSINEPWHWVHSGAFMVSNPIGGGGSVSTPTIPGAPAPLKEWDEMASKDEVKQAVRDGVYEVLVGNRAGAGARNLYDLGNQTLVQLGALSSEVAGVKAQVDAVPYRTGVELRVDGRNIFDWFKQTRSEQAAGFAAVSGKTSATDTAGLAKAIADQLPDDLARKVADELANRLKG